MTNEDTRPLPKKGVWKVPAHARGGAPVARERDQQRQRPEASLRESPAPGRPAGFADEAPQIPRLNAGEQRIYGMHAVLAVHAKRPNDVRKLWVANARMHALRDLLRWCAANRVGYSIVDAEELERISGSQHHEGIVAQVMQRAAPDFATWLGCLKPGPACALWLDGVGNPHNLGAILRSAAHFGISAVLVPNTSTLALSAAAMRVAEGGAEAVPLIRLPAAHSALEALGAAGFTAWATVVSGGENALQRALPQRLVLVMGAEQEGMDRELAQACNAQVSIAGTGAVESLNVASASAVLMALWAQHQHH